MRSRGSGIPPNRFLGYELGIHEILIYTTSVQLKITNPRGGGRIHAKTANYGLVVVYMDRA